MRCGRAPTPADVGCHRALSTSGGLHLLISGSAGKLCTVRDAVANLVDRLAEIVNGCECTADMRCQLLTAIEKDNWRKGRQRLFGRTVQADILICIIERI